jgi:ATP-dependent DNA helicase RecQ
MTMNRYEAEIILKVTFQLDHFYDEQWVVIEKILIGERVLLIEKTGFGKSLCFQFPLKKLLHTSCRC